MITGGEGFVIGWREQIKKQLNPESRIFSAYGASDLDIGIAFETPLTIFIRTQLIENKELREKLGKSGRYPMIFQYNPLAHYIANFENNNHIEEFHITPLDPSVAAPKIKYNIHMSARNLVNS